MTIKKMHQLFKLYANKLDTNNKVDLPAAHIDDIFNTVINDYVEIFYSGNNAKAYKFGFEVTQQRIDMLSNLVVDFPDQPLIVPDLIESDIFKIDLTQLKYPYKHFLRGYADTQGCGVINIIPRKHDQFNKMLNDPFQKPSKTWRRILAKFASGPSMLLYTDDFIISSVKLEYLKKPKKVFYGGYDTLEYINGDETAPNSNTSPIDSDINDDYHELLVQMAVQEFNRIIDDYNKVNAQTEKIITTS